MNCREAFSLISAERDGALEARARSNLEAHLAACDSCRQARSSLTAALESWRTEASRVQVPDAGQEWLAVRRRLRGGADSGAAPGPAARRTAFAWLAVPLAAAAAIALVLFVPRPGREDPAGAHSPAVARADSIEVPGANTSTMVFVDDQSGWLIVWASDAGGKSG